MYGYPNGKPRVREVPFDEIEDPVELADATFDFALENSRPKLQLRASGLQFETVSLGEIVTIIGKNDIRYKTRVFKIKKDFLREKVVSFEFGDRIARTMGDRLKAEQVAEKEKEITEQNYIKAMIEMVENSYFNEDGYQYDLKAGNEYDLPAGIYSFNKPIDQNPDKVIYFGAGKLMIANSKKPDGSWNFSVAIDGDAVNANVIRAGILRGGRVEWDLQNGTFKIGGQRDDTNTLQDPNMFWDGNTLHLREVDIDLSNNYQIQNIENNISSVDKKIDQSSEELGAILDEAKTDFGVQLDVVDKKINTVSQDLQIGQGKLESTINGRIDGLANVVTTNQAGFEEYKLENVKIIGDIKSDIKQTAGSIETSVASQIQTVNDKIDSKDSAVRDYIKNNYSTTLQTDEKIQSTVASEVTVLEGKISGANDSLKKYVETNYSTKEQTDTAITNTVAREVKTVDENLRSYISGNYSTTTQTADMIQSKVSDEVDKAKLALSGDSADLKKYIETNYSTKTQTKDAITSEVVSASKVLKDDISREYYTKSQTDSKIKQTADGIETTVTQVNNALYGGGYDKNGKYIPANESITSKISQTAGMIKSEVTDLKDYVVQNYSSITQTSTMIKSEVGLIKSDLADNYSTKTQTSDLIETKVSSTDKKLREDIEATYSTIRQTSDMIESKVSPIRSDLSNNYSTKTQTSELIENKIRPVNNRLSSAESSIKQTADEISTKVSKNGIISSINQSSESVKIQSGKINLKGATIVDGIFETADNGRKIRIDNGQIRFFKNNYNVGSIGAGTTDDNQGVEINFTVSESEYFAFHQIFSGYIRPVVEIGQFVRTGAYSVTRRGTATPLTDEKYIIKTNSLYANQIIGVNYFKLSGSGTDFIIKDVRNDTQFLTSRYKTSIKGHDTQYNKKYSFEISPNGMFYSGSGVRFEITSDGLEYHGNGTWLILQKDYLNVNGELIR